MVETNAERARYAEEALLHYADRKGLLNSEEDMETALGDLLSDLRHLTRLAGLDVTARWEGNRDTAAEEAIDDPDGYWSPLAAWPAVKW